MTIIKEYIDLTQLLDCGLEILQYLFHFAKSTFATTVVNFALFRTIQFAN